MGFENNLESKKEVITPEQVKANVEKFLSEALAEIEVIAKENSATPNIKEELLKSINNSTEKALNVRNHYDSMYSI